MSSVSSVSSVSDDSCDDDDDMEFSLRDFSDDDNAVSAVLDFSSAYDHPWLKDFTERSGPLIHSSESSEYDIYSYFFLLTYSI